MYHNNKAITIIKSLNDSEVVDLNKFIHSPYHNTNKDVLNLFQILYKKYPEIQLTKEQIWFSLYEKDRAFDDLRLRHVFSSLVKVLEEFLVLNNYRKNDIDFNFQLLSIYNDKRLESYYHNVREKLEYLTAKEPLRGTKYYYNHYLLELDKGKFIEKQKNRAIDPNFLGISQSLDIFYFIQKLKLYCSAINYQNLIAKTFQLELIHEILQKTDEPPFSEVVLIKIYKNALNTLIDYENETHFNNLNTLIFENIILFPDDEKNDMLILAKNYCIKRVNNGDDKYYKILLNIYQLEIENLLNNQNLSISPFTFKNIVSVALQLKEFDWAIDFIEKFHSKLDEEFRENMYSFNLAKYNFAVGNFKQVLKSLAKVEYNEVFMYLDSKVLLMKTFYELRDIDMLNSMVDSMRMYLKRKETLSYHSDHYHNFLKIIKKLYKINSGEMNKTRALREEMEQLGKIISKDWLLEKINLLERSKA